MNSSTGFRTLLMTGLLLCLGMQSVAHAQFDLEAIRNNTPSFGDSRDVVSVEVRSQRTTASAGTTFPVAVTFKMKKGWHIWTQENGSPEGMAIFDGAQWTSITKTGGSGLEIIDIAWPDSHSREGRPGIRGGRICGFRRRCDRTRDLDDFQGSSLRTPWSPSTLRGSFRLAMRRPASRPRSTPPTTKVSVTIDSLRARRASFRRSVHRMDLRRRRGWRRHRRNDA